MTTRTDIHRPAELVTESYEFLFAFDSQAGDRLDSRAPITEWIIEQMRLRARAENLVRTSSVDRGTTQCHHCGAHLRYAAILRHTSGEHIAVGETCLENRFSRATAEFQRLRKNSQHDRERQRILTARAAFVEANPDLAFMNLHPTQRELNVAANDGSHFIEYNRGAGASQDNVFIADVARKLVNYGELSERQVEAVRRSMQRDIEFAARRAEREAAEAAEPRTPVVTGRQQVVGTVVSTKWVDNDYGGSLKMLVKDDRGFKVWGTVPSAIEVERGTRVTFAAAVEASRDDEYFGFFKRPTKAQVIGVAA